MLSVIPRPATQTIFEERGSGRISSPTCSECYSFLDGICQLKASADWGSLSKVSPTRTACFLAELFPF